MIQPLTYEEVKAGLEQLADEFPGRVAADRYVTTYDGNKPHCILGHLLHRAGVSVAALLRLDGVEDQVEVEDYFEHDDGACRLAMRAMDEQDGGAPWREAVDRALADCAS